MVIVGHDGTHGAEGERGRVSNYTRLEAGPIMACES